MKLLPEKPAKKQQSPLPKINFMNRKHKILSRKRRHKRVRAKVSGTSKMPRVAVFKSASHIYVQAVDDTKGKTILFANDLKTKDKNKTKKSLKVGEALGELMKKEGITKALFDRGGFKYHGRVKALAEGLRSAGIKI